MHEYSLVEGVVKQLRASAKENDIKQISRVVLVVGKLTMAVPIPCSLPSRSSGSRSRCSRMTRSWRSGRNR